MAIVASEVEPLYHYVIVRRDLPLGMMAAQIIHAAGESATGVQPETHAVCLAAQGQDHLRKIAERLTKAGVAHHAITEVDAPWTDQLMAIGIAPCRRTLLRKVLSDLPLLKA